MRLGSFATINFIPTPPKGEMRTPSARISTVLTMSNSENFEDLLAQFDESHPTWKQTEPGVGDKVQGTIFSIGEEHVYIDIGFKSEGVM